VRQSPSTQAATQPYSSPAASGAPFRERDGARILRFKQVTVLVGLGKTSIYRKVQEGTFPKPIKLGSPRASGWLSTEIYDWIEEQVARSRKVA